jgi:hypothetical protein
MEVTNQSTAPNHDGDEYAVGVGVSQETLDRILSPNFNDGWVEKGCIKSCAYRPPVGKMPYTLCSNPCEHNMVCNDCLKTAIGDSLNRDSQKTGFNITCHRERNVEQAKRWAFNKKKILEREHVNILSSSSDESDEM